MGSEEHSAVGRKRIGRRPNLLKDTNGTRSRVCEKTGGKTLGGLGSVTPASPGDGVGRYQRPDQGVHLTSTASAEEPN